MSDAQSSAGGLEPSAIVRSVSARLLLAVSALSTPMRARADDGSAPPPVKQASDAEARYARHMDLGVRLFEDRNYDAALSEFELAYEAKRVASPLINIALCHKGRFEYPSAVAVLERALAEHRDTIDAPENIERAAAELRELLATVEIRVEPAGAQASVLLDGVVVPASELRALHVSPGSHEIVVRAEGYAEARLPFRVASGTSRTLPIALTSTFGRLRVTSADPRVRVLLDGVERGLGATTVALPAGNHVLVIRAEDGDLYTLNVSIVADREVEVALGEDGFVRVGDTPPRGPDEVVRPPVRGFYVSGGVGGGVLAGYALQGFVGFDATLGYQLSNVVGLGVTVRQSLPIPGTEEVIVEGLDFNVDSITQVGAALRLTTDTERARFLSVFHLGFSYSIASVLATAPDDFQSVAPDPAPGFSLGLEPGLEVEVSQLLFGFTTPIFGNVSNIGTFQIGARAHVGYGFW